MRWPWLPTAPVTAAGSVVTTATERHTVLHVEDDPASATLVERILAQRGDIDIVAATNGCDALDLARDHRPALILLDRHLPGDLDGDDVLEQLRDDPATACIPVVMISANPAPDQIHLFLRAGAAAYLTKPIDIPRMVEVVGEVLSA